MTNTTIVFYIGAPSSNFDQLTWSLRRDDLLLSEHGVMARKPKMYRATISDRMVTQQLGELSNDDRKKLYKKLSMGEEKSRLILTDSCFLDEPVNMLREGRLYANAGRLTQELRLLFPDNPIEFLLSIRNPVSLVSEISDRLANPDFTNAANDTDFSKLKWLDVVSDIREANPDSAIKVWCYEDSPFLWPEILRSAANLPASVPLKGELDFCAVLMDERSLARLRKFLDDRPKLKPHEKRQIISAFLEKFAAQEEVDQDIGLASVDSDLLDEANNRYVSDFEECKKVAGVVAFG